MWHPDTSEPSAVFFVAQPPSAVFFVAWASRPCFSVFFSLSFPRKRESSFFFFCFFLCHSRLRGNDKKKKKPGRPQWTPQLCCIYPRYTLHITNHTLQITPPSAGGLPLKLRHLAIVVQRDGLLCCLRRGPVRFAAQLFRWARLMDGRCLPGLAGGCALGLF